MEALEQNYLRIGQDFIRKGGDDDWQVGKRLFEEVTQLYPKSADGFWNLGKCYHESVMESCCESEKEEKEFLKKAEELYKQAIKLEPNNADYHIDMGFNFRLQNKDKEAVKEFQKAIEIDPEDLDTYELIALTHYEGLKDYPKAVDAYRDAFEKARSLIHHGC